MDVDQVRQITTQIVEEFERALIHRVELQQELERLQAAGMYPAVPSEQWQDRNGGEKKYLYMIFPWGSGCYQGPDGARKIYIGCDPARISEARRLVANRRRFEAVSRTLSGLDQWFFLFDSSLRYDFRRFSDWPRFDLGPVAGGQAAPGCPNGGKNG